jgi:hypothetical protein
LTCQLIHPSNQALFIEKRKHPVQKRNRHSYKPALPIPLGRRQLLLFIRQKEKGFSTQKPHFHISTIILLAFPFKPNLYRATVK